MLGIISRRPDVVKSNTGSPWTGVFREASSIYNTIALRFSLSSEVNRALLMSDRKEAHFSDVFSSVRISLVEIPDLVVSGKGWTIIW